MNRLGPQYNISALEGNSVMRMLLMRATPAAVSLSRLTQGGSSGWVLPCSHSFSLNTEITLLSPHFGGPGDSIIPFLLPFQDLAQSEKEHEFAVVS